ncbi:MAG: hypothetical protein EKK64_06800 [Neisseriaceae bacterium]|nr:MAG: hypothetical protein EKK64_06800 [Neisseriaceae bacterium]
MIDHQKEIIKCSSDFFYFCENYIFIKTINFPVKFKLYEYQKRLFNHWEKHDHSIQSKFRQGGFTTLVTIYALWLCLFKENQKVVFCSNSDSMSLIVGESILKFAIATLPDWLKGNVLKMTSQYQKKFEDTNSTFVLKNPKHLSTIGEPISLLILDEIDTCFTEKNWSAVYPYIKGKVIAQSTLSNNDTWFWGKLIDAKIKINSFNSFECHYKERPEFDEKWEIEMKKNSIYWEQEFEQKAIDTDVKEIIKETKQKKKRYRDINEV